MISGDVAVVIVTYGRRWHLLQEVLKALDAYCPQVKEVVVVDNGSSEDLKEGLQARLDLDVELISLPQNTGSANGYRIGIEAVFRNSSAEFLWLLDDDNQPCPQSLENLLRAYALLGSTPDNALLSLRRNRREFLEAACNGSSVGIGKNSFHGFHVKSLHRQIVRFFRWSKGMKNGTFFSYPLISVGYATYGGFFFHRSWIDKIGLPDERFFLYADDHEYSGRIVRAGGMIYLCASSEIHDLEESCHWGVKYSPHLLSITFDMKRLYFSTRNRVYLETRWHVTSRTVYLFNITVCLLILFVRESLASRRPRKVLKHLLLVILAIGHGWRGKLGVSLPTSFNLS